MNWVIYRGESHTLNCHKRKICDLVLKHARAWAEPCHESFTWILHPKILFAYPTTKLDSAGEMADFDTFVQYFTNTMVTIPWDGIIINWKMGHVSVHWKFLTYLCETGVHQVVNDACLGIVCNGKFVQWMEFLDGCVKTMQAARVLSYGDGPDGVMKPWPAFVPGKESCHAIVTVLCPLQ
jgi:hypothetical protein